MDHADHDHAAELLAPPKAASSGHAGHAHGGSGEFAGLEGADLAAACAAALADSCSTPGNALALRIASIFIVGFCSALGVYLPLVLSRVRGRGRRGRGGAATNAAPPPTPLLAKDRAAFFVFKAFGAGVILATGLVHMFPGAIGFLASPCLGWPSFSWAGTIATATIVCVMLIEHGLTALAERRLHARLRAMAGNGGNNGSGSGKGGLVAKGGHGHSRGKAAADDDSAASAADAHAGHDDDQPHHHPHPGRPHSTACDDVEATGRAARRPPTAPHTTACCPPSPCPDGVGAADAACAAGDLSLAAVHGPGAAPHGHGHTHDRGEDCVVAARHAAVAQVLEVGIALHSVLIGISLGVGRTACEVRPLLAAITFHQTFEGLALGGCLIEAEYSARAHAALGLFYALSTPLGIGIGLALSSSYSPNAPSALAVSGVFDSVSAGILIYMALVDLIAADFASKRFRADGRLQVAGFAALAVGAGLMCLLALWA
jgi:solute carrier family 39 (zinc transporter), member 1/2/3